MKRFMLMHKDIVVSIFEMDGNNVTAWYIPKSANAQNHMPLPLKRIAHYINGGYIEEETPKAYKINEEGIFYLEQWLSDRAIPINRDNIQKYVRNKNTIEFMLNNNSASLTDCYWTKEINENIDWNRVKLYGKSSIDKLQVISHNSDCGETYSGINATLGGQLEKYWYYSYTKGTAPNLMLAKRTNINDSILNIREVIASKIYELQGYENYCKYNYIRNTYGQIVGCKCRAFTDEQLELITAYDLLEEYGYTQADGIYELIINLAHKYGANITEVRYQLDIQTLVDYLITNRDRHQNNVGFLRNPDTLQIIKIAPIFDSGSSAFMEGVLPLGVENTTVHNLYNTEMQCLQSVYNIKSLNISKLPDIKWVRNEFRKANNFNEYTVNNYLQLYISKIEYLKSRG